VNSFLPNLTKQNLKLIRYDFFGQILIDVKMFLTDQPTLVDVTVPDDHEFTVCGDIHGQFYDLMNIFKINGEPSEKNPYVSFCFFHLISKLLVFCRTLLRLLITDE